MGDPDTLRILDPSKVKIFKDEFNRMWLRIGDELIPDARPVRALPISNPNKYIFFFDKDGKEVGMIQDPSKLDQNSKKVLFEELKLIYFIPKIKKIYSLVERYGASSWEVETDIGRKRFEVQERENIRVLQGRKVVIKDVDGNLYEIPDYYKLDPSSRALLETEI